LQRHKLWVLKGGFGILLAVLLACLCWTYSRSSWIGYLVILFVMPLLDRRKLLFSGVLLMIFIVIFLPSLNHARNLNLVSDNSSGASLRDADFMSNLKPNLSDIGSGRFEYWKKAVSIIYSSPVWGTGLNTYTRVIKRDSNQVSWRYAHNCYLQMTAETGLAGLFCFLWMVFVLYQQGIRSFKLIKDEWMLPLLQGLVIGLLGFLVQSFLDNTFYTVQLGMYMWLIFGFIVAVILLNPKAENE